MIRYIMILATGAGVHAATLEVPSQFATIQAAVNAAQPGDLIQIAPGTYSEEVTTSRSGNEANRITVDGLNAGSVVVKRWNFAHSFWTVRNLTIKGQNNTYQMTVEFRLGANANQLLNCVVDCQRTLKVHGIAWASRAGQSHLEASDNLIEACRVQNVYGATMVSMSGMRNVIRNSLIADGAAVDFLRLMGANNLVQGNIFRDNLAASGTGNHPDFVQTFGNNGEQSYGHVIEGNRVDNIPAGQLCQLSATGMPDIRDWTIRNNVFTRIAMGGGGSMPGQKWHNNIFYKIGSALSFGIRTYGYRTGLVSTHRIYSETIQITPSGSLVAEGDRGHHNYGGYYRVNAWSLEPGTPLMAGRQYQADVNTGASISYNGQTYTHLQVFTAVEGVTAWSINRPAGSTLSANLYPFATFAYKNTQYKRGQWFKCDPAVRTYTSTWPEMVGAIRIVIEFANGSEVKNNAFLECGDGTPSKSWYSFDLNLRNVSADYNYVAGPNFAPKAQDTQKRAVGSAGGWDVWKWYEPNGVNGGDPGFVDVAAGDFMLSSTSFLIDRGASIVGLVKDFHGVGRPQGKGFDIGPFEYGGSTLGSRPRAPGGLKVFSTN